MRLTVVGCSGSFPGPESTASCYLLEAEHDDGTGSRTWRVLLDLGNGSLGALQRHADPLAVDAVVLSHLHADHCLDMCGYHVLRRYHPDGPQPRIPVLGPAGTADRLARAYDLPLDPGMREEFDFHVLPAAGEHAVVGPFTVEALPVLHPVDAYGVRVRAGGPGGPVLAYTGDTAPCPALDVLADGVNLLLAEASFREVDDNPPGIHLTGADCGRLAARTRPGRLVLTHVPPWHDADAMLAEAAAHFDGPTQLARAGLVVDLG